jgi:hypothetical protein
MKKLLVVLVFVLMGTITYAQWATSGTNIYSTNTGKVGIGNGGAFTPTSIFEVARNATAPAIAIRNLGGGGGAEFIMYDQLSTAEWKFKSIGTGGFKIRDQKNARDVVQIEPATTAGAVNALYITSAGKVGIGTTNPLARLSVDGTGTFNGKVKCTEIEVLVAAWPDFVFESNYNLLPLSEVENFINVNKHLPGVPSQEAVLANGANLGEMNATLLQKVEELTLYMIQLQKDNDALKTRISNLEK